MDPADLVAELDACFSAFDEITVKHGLEKIKTIGDGYLCVSGLPEESPDHALKAIEAAKEMIAFMETRAGMMKSASHKEVASGRRPAVRDAEEAASGRRPAVGEEHDDDLKNADRLPATAHRSFMLRIGINTGPVVAGVVGTKKFAFDIWGDTVNTAARLESAGEPGRINISGTTRELIKDKFPTTHRGNISVKNKGEVEMWWVGK
jgi:class 3 adenylate cyclase